MIDREALARWLYRIAHGDDPATMSFVERLHDSDEMVISFMAADLAPIIDELEAGRRYKRAGQNRGPEYEERRERLIVWFKAMQALDAHLARLGVKT